MSTDLARCGGDSDLVLERLLAILRTATGLDGDHLRGSVNATSGEVYPPSVSVKLPKAKVTAVERINMWSERDGIKLACWPAELKSQYTAVYSSAPKIRALADAEALSHWHIRPNFQLAFPFSAAAMRWYPRRHLTGRQYVTQWVDDLRENRAGARRRADIERSVFWDWLIGRRYADPDDRQGFDVWVNKQPAKRQIHIRPGIEIIREWDFGDAVARDNAGQLTAEVRGCIDEILGALGEPSLQTINE